MSILNDHMRPDFRPDLRTDFRTDLRTDFRTELRPELQNNAVTAKILHHNIDLPMTSTHDPTASCSPLGSTESKVSFIFTQEQVECVCEVSVKAKLNIEFSRSMNETKRNKTKKKRRSKRTEKRSANVWFPHGISLFSVIFSLFLFFFFFVFVIQ